MDVLAYKFGIDVYAFLTRYSIEFKIWLSDGLIK